jgi:phage terminase large subunit-like protein
MRNEGFKIKEVRYDRRFSEEFVVEMNALKFVVKDQKQLYLETTKGFNRIERAAEEGRFYYLGAESFEYCLQNVYVVERPGGFKQFSKIPGELAKYIDIFAAAVFAATGLVEMGAKAKQTARIIGI